MQDVSLDLQGELDPRFGIVERRVQRFGWVFIAAILIAAIGGLFGGGPFSDTTARHTSQDGEITLSYARLGRAESDLQLELRVNAPETPGSPLEVVLDGSFLEKVSLTNVIPTPDAEAVQGDAIVYTWDVEDWGQVLAVRIEYQWNDWRLRNGRIDVSAGDESLGSLRFEQFIFP